MDNLQTLRNKIDRADSLYYNGRDSGVPDSLYDQWKDELAKLAPDDERLSRVGAPVSKDSVLTKRKHTHFMGSQNKASTPEEFETWYKSVGSPEVFINLKVDGASARAYYVNGKIDAVVTRGDGVEGEDITSNAALWIDFPMNVDPRFNGSVRGEAVLYKKEWEIVDPDSASNPRNLGSGIIQRSDGHNNEYMRFLGFDLTFDDGKKVPTEEKKIGALEALGFNVSRGRVCRNLQEVMDEYERVSKVRSELPFWIDGLVVKINDVPTQEGHGISGNRPKGQVSFKFPPEQAESVIEDVILAVGHTGAISITAVLSPTRLGGTTVTKATLHNFDNVKALDVAIGDTVIIHKGGDIIPQVVEVKSRPENRIPIPIPEVCPECGGDVGRRLNVDGEESAIVECKNPDCDAKGEGKIKRFVTGTDILGIGDTIREQLFKLGLVRKVSDLYRLDVDTLSRVKAGNTVGESKAKSIVDEINKKRRLTIEQFMGSLGVNSLARGRVADVREKCPGEFDTVADWLTDKILTFKDQAGVPNIAEKIYEGIQRIKPMIEELVTPSSDGGIGIEIIPDEPKAAPVAGPLNGTSFILTGTFEVKKSEIEAKVVALGGEISESVAKGVVVVYAKAGSAKHKKGEKLGCKTYSEAEFMDYLASL